MSQDKVSQLQKDNVIPDVLPESVDLSYDLVIKWPNTTLDEPGKELGREETQPQPSIHLVPPPQEKHSDYTLIMTDPDLMATNDTNFGQVRHWLAINASVDDDGRLDISKAGDISPYIGPAPLPNYISHRPHRYVFILSRPSGTGKVTVDGEDLKKLQQNYPAAFEGKQDLQDLKDRWGFNAQKLLEEKELKPEAVTFMYVAGTLQSAAANIAMTTQAAVNKVLGK